MKPEADQANKWRGDIAFLGQAASHYPEGHAARELFHDEATELADLIVKDKAIQEQRRADAKRREVRTTRSIGGTVAALGIVLLAFGIPDGNWMLWTGL